VREACPSSVDVRERALFTVKQLGGRSALKTSSGAGYRPQPLLECRAWGLRGANQRVTALHLVWRPTGDGTPAERGAPIGDVDLGCRAHTEDCDPFIKSQLATRNSHQGLTRCILGHVTPQNRGERNPRGPPCGEGVVHLRGYRGGLVFKAYRPLYRSAQGSKTSQDL